MKVSNLLVFLVIFWFGLSTWYGESFRGQTMANGYRFNPDNISAACHPGLLGEWLLVTNIDNGYSIWVECTDTGPFYWDWRWGWVHMGYEYIDLSREAFSWLAPLDQGVMDVKIELIDDWYEQ